MNDLKISLCQYNMKWEQRDSNMNLLSASLESYFTSLNRGEFSPDIVLFPEMFLTGFTMNGNMAECEEGDSLKWMKSIAREYNIAVVGSLPIMDGGKIFNRCFFVAPKGTYWKYDKRHLFSYGGEDSTYSPGNERVVVQHLGWRVALSICYDLRFPVWMRNNDLEYDVMLNLASWPSSRISVTDTLSKARAIENMSYFAFVNRIGEDESGDYCGSSRVIDPKGRDIGVEERVGDVLFVNAQLSYTNLKHIREKFQAWKDADKYCLL